MNNGSFIKGMGIGLAVGATMGMMVAPKKSGKSVVSKTVKAVGDIIDNVADNMGI